MKRLPLCSSSSSFFFPPPLFSQPPFADRLLHNGTPQKCGSRRGGRRRLCEKVRGNETKKRLERVQKKVGKASVAQFFPPLYKKPSQPPSVPYCREQGFRAIKPLSLPPPPPLPAMPKIGTPTLKKHRSVFSSPPHLSRQLCQTRGWRGFFCPRGRRRRRQRR